MWDILLAEDPGLDLVDMVCVAMLLRIRWQCKFTLQKQIAPADHLNSDRGKLLIRFDVTAQVPSPCFPTGSANLCG